MSSEGKHERDSNIECLRLLCIFFIVMMHSVGSTANVVTGVNKYFVYLVNCIGNAGVSVFALISGYYGIGNGFKKSISLHKIVMMYSILSLIVEYILIPEVISINYIIKSFFPIVSRKYWYITCYFVVLLLANTFNWIIENMSQKMLKHSLIVMFIFLSLFPTFFFTFNDIMLDGGKGLMWIIFLYFLGGYIKKYQVYRMVEKYCYFIGGGALILMFISTVILSKYFKIFTAPFCRDLSTLTLAFSCSVLGLFLSKSFHSKYINKIAGNVIAIYLFEGVVREYLLRKGVINLSNNPTYIIDVFILDICVFFICIAINFILNFIFGKVNSWLSEKEIIYLYKLKK